MPRPKLNRFINIKVAANIWKPQGIPARMLEMEDITMDELAALKMVYMDDLNQKDGALKMKISQQTFSRLIHSANRKIVRALSMGHAIKLHEAIDLNFPTRFPGGHCRGRRRGGRNLL